MGDLLLRMIREPFVLGLAAGLVIGLFLWWSSRKECRRLRRRVSELTDHVGTQAELASKGTADLRGEVEKLRKQNENLRISLKTWQSKPGRAELRALHVYDRAVHLMNERAPGFSGAWESAVREAEGEVEESEMGIRSLVRKFFRAEPPRRGLLSEGERDEESDEG